MKITEIRSDKVYDKILNAKADKKDDIYRYDLMSEFYDKWACYNVPIKAKQKGGYDVIMASSMLGYMAPSEIDESKSQEVKSLNDDAIWKLCTESIKKALSLFVDAGVELKVEEYKYTILLPNPESVYTKLSESC
ncbi:MAG: Zn-dependent protease, partial [Intestinibacter sp.]|nr:Zn-dependent protease [Intestinibacter sp.]